MSQVIVTTPDELRSVICNAINDALQQVPSIRSDHELDTLRRKEYLTTEEVEKLYGLNSDSLNSLRCRKKGPPYVKMGAKVLYRRISVQDYLEAHRVRLSD